MKNGDKCQISVQLSSKAKSKLMGDKDDYNKNIPPIVRAIGACVVPANVDISTNLP